MAGHMGHGRQTGTEKVKDFKGTLLRLGKYLKPYRMSLLLVILVAVTSVIFTIISPKIMAKITDELFRPILEKLLEIRIQHLLILVILEELFQF